MHHEKQARHVLRVDCDRRAVGQGDERLKRRMGNLEKRFDARNFSHDPNRIRAIDPRDGLNDKEPTLYVNRPIPLKSVGASIELPQSSS